MISTCDHIQRLYEKLEGKFITSAAHIAEKLNTIQAFIFDWDGVFNAGVKGVNLPTTFSEIDAMGINLLRLSYWLKNKTLFPIAIITGENNPAACQLAQREHFNAVYFGVKNKKIALTHFCKQYDSHPKEIAFVFDDVLDLSIAQAVSLRFMLRITANPLFSEYIIENKLADYLTAQPGSGNGVRAVTELIIGLQGNYEATLAERMHYTDSYQTYLRLRNKMATTLYAYKNEKIELEEIK